MMGNKEELDKYIDIITDQERDYAQNALSDFQKKNFTSCLQNINKLDKRSDDFKVIHNKHVAEYYKSDMKKTGMFQKNLSALFKQLGLKIDKLDDVDHCVLYYNQAVLLFHQRQYTQALNIMDRVYKFIEPMDEILARQVGLLLLELYISVRQIEKAVNLITYLKNQALNQSQNTPVIKILTKHPKPDNKKIIQPISPEAEIFLKKLNNYRLRMNLLNHSLTISRSDCLKLYTDSKSMDSILLMANQEYLEGNFAEAEKLLLSIPVDTLKYSECGESSSVLINNNIGVLYHAMGKPNLACHYYQQALKEDLIISKRLTDSNDKTLHTLGGSKYHELIYNLGISLLHANKPTQAFDCLIIAVRRYHRNSRLWLRLAECCIAVHRPTNVVDFDVAGKQHELVVNVIGSGQGQKVILTTSLSDNKKYSSDSSQSYAVPVANLEFASLCLRNALLLLPSPLPITKATTTTTAAGGSATGATRSLLVVNTANNTTAGNNNTTTNNSQQQSTVSSASLSSSITCGVIAHSVAKQAATAATTATLSPPPGVAPSAPLLHKRRIDALHHAILVANAYVCLHLGDYVLALEHSTALLKHRTKPAGVHKLLAHLYAAEALVLLDKISEALDHLHPENIKDISLVLPSDGHEGTSAEEKDDGKLKTSPPTRWFPNNLETALSVMQYNVAVAKAIRGQLDQSSALLKQIWKSRSNEVKVPAHIIMLVLYIELQLGHIDAARTLIKQYSIQHRFKG